MRSRRFLALSEVGVGACLALATACGSDGGSPGEKKTNLDVSVCDPGTATFSLVIDNAYLPLSVGSEWIYRGDEDGILVDLRITVLDETEMVAGVETRVVEESADEDGELHEVARNFFAQASDGTVCYFGEDVSFYENGMVVNHEGQWRAGEGGAKPGIAMPFEPAVGMAYDMEVAPGVSEDHAEVVAVAEPFAVPAGSFDDTLDTEETTPLEPEVRESKRYASGVGLIVSGPLLLEQY